VAGGWRKQKSEEFYNLYTSSNIIRVKKLKRIRWEGHEARMRERERERERREINIIFWLENLKGRDHLKDLGMDGKAMLELILRKQRG
jgi:hypothetical protein